jgi:hypothetical protein
MAIGRASMIDENCTKCNAIVFCKIVRVGETKVASRRIRNDDFSTKSIDFRPLPSGRP